MIELLLGFVLVVPVAPVTAVADRPVPNTLTSEERAAGFKLLFNGKDLSGWEHNGPPGTFHVEHGILVGKLKPGTAYWLSTREQFGDFELRLQYMIDRNGNSGVFIRAPREGRTSREGMEIQIVDDANSSRPPHKGSTGAIYGVVPPRVIASKPAGQWNDLWIRCEGDRVTVTLNGIVVNDVHMNDHPELRNRPRRGYIGLSAHTGVVRYRTIRIKVLDAAKQAKGKTRPESHEQTH